MEVPQQNYQMQSQDLWILPGILQAQKFLRRLAKFSIASKDDHSLLGYIGSPSKENLTVPS